MGSELQIDNVFIQVRDKLLKDGVKLWQEPYYVSSIASIEDLERLAEDYSKCLKLPLDSCYAAISELQTHALEKLKQRDRFKESGLATLKIKILNPKAPPKLISKEILLSASGSDLKNVVSSVLEVPQEKLKLIASGKVLHDTESLHTQNVHNGQQILALMLNESSTELKEAESRIHEIESIKADTRLLASDDSEYMELEDQAGNPINIPSKERKALMIAMALHEKGRAALKKDDFGRALVFFLDADHEFSQCNAQVLNMVDNYALLDLDIAWCYLCLQSVSHLPEAFSRLKRCEAVFEKSYGPNLERLIALKGTPGNEAALVLRLHLLQGIVLFHQNRRKEALQLFKKVESEMQQLKVDENSVTALVELGHTTAEARLGLRATHGDVNLAANYINENREKRIQSRKKAMAEKILEKEKRKLGKCADGNQFVNPTFVKMLVNMGFNKEAARLALQKSNNIISDSIQYIQENPGPSGTRSQELISLINDLIPELEAAGFDYNMAKLALEKHNGDILQAAEELIQHDGVVTNVEDFLSAENFTETEDDKNSNKSQKDEEKAKMKEEAFMRLSQDISIADDDHLDLTLQQEELFLKQYMTLLQD